MSIGVPNKLKDFSLKCKKCGSSDVIATFTMLSDTWEDVDEYEDEIDRIGLKCTNCGLVEMQEYDFI